MGGQRLKTVMPDWNRAKSDYTTMMAAFHNPAKPIGDLTWSTVGKAFTTAENDSTRCLTMRRAVPRMKRCPAQPTVPAHYH